MIQSWLLFGLSVLFHMPVLAQETLDSVLLNGVLQRIEQGILAHNELSYSAEMQFKGFGEDDFEVRNFAIAFRKNEANPLNGYDVMVSEPVDSGFLFTIMTIDSAMYYISEEAKKISGRPLPAQVETGSYLETLKQYFVFSEYVYPFFNLPLHALTLEDSTDHFILTCQTTPVSTRSLHIYKHSVLPLKYVTTIINEDIGASQVQIVHFYFDSAYMQLPEHAFSIKYYTDLDYTYTYYGEAPAHTDTVKKTFSIEDLDKLLHYPFVNSTEDTVRLAELTYDVLLLNFWYASCLPCLLALPRLSLLSDKYRNSDVQVIGINAIDYESRISLNRKLADKGIHLHVWYGKQDILRELDIRSFPAYFIVTQEGSIWEIGGGIENVEETLEALAERK